MKNVELKSSKKQTYLLRIQQTFVQDEKYKIFCWKKTTQEAESIYLKEEN